MDKHGEGYIGTDDAMPDSFDEWCRGVESHQGRLTYKIQQKIYEKVME
jgi:hypothetical protein